jgi:hypothetical protein
VPALIAELGGAAPPAPAPAPTVAVEPTRRLALDDPDLPQPLPMPAATRPARQRAGLLGVGLAAAGLVAAAPYVGAVLLAVAAAVLRFASVVHERHTERRLTRGRPRWYDVPASALASPAYLLFSLVGTGVLLAGAVAAVAVVGLVAAVGGASETTGLVLTGLVYVGCLWWGPASRRVRRRTVRLTRRWAAPTTRSGPLALALGVALAVVLAGLLAGRGPVWSPDTHAPWDHGWLSPVAGVVR